MDKQIQEKVIRTLQAFPRRLAVISTISEDGIPHVAPVYYFFDENLNIYFVTRMSTQKYKNLLNNSNVAMVAWQEHPIRTIQIEGKATVVNEPIEQEKYFSEVMKIVYEAESAPPVKQMMDSEIALIKIVPSKAQLSEFDPQNQTPTFQEINF